MLPLAPKTCARIGLLTNNRLRFGCSVAELLQFKLFGINMIPYGTENVHFFYASELSNSGCIGSQAIRGSTF